MDVADDRTGGDPYADFWAPDPPCPREGAPRAGRRRGLGAVLAAALLAASPIAPASAVPAPRPAESLDELQERADRLSDDYNGELRDMEAVFEDAEKAQERADTTREEVEDARDQVRQLAIAGYTSSGLEPSLTVFVEEDPQRLIDQAQIIGHLSGNHQARIDDLEKAIERDEKASDNAREKAEKVEEDLEELEERREEVQGLIADHPEQEMGPPDNLTPRTRQMRDLVREKFGDNKEHGGYGCYRPDGGYVVGEHPKGRACDFMVDKNGQMPSQDQIDHGWDIAHWAQDNAERLGIMYVIYRQQIWDVRRDSEGWRDMADRGSITENHFDHVHISMF
ncbi:coiled-coil domain-containing protein [Nocardiopsis halophila]|uniref:coiled-coil domain-containing protein n=1 Tax=Nocardiopsis halophila TaxID=141692 RepID=UPI000347B971|nr:hypothetical protein [Nocardiopsis halophila]